MSGKPLKICFSGFQIQTKKGFEQFVIKLGGVHDEKYTFDTNILISANPLSIKYIVNNLYLSY